MSSDLCLFAVQITTNARFFFELSFIFGYLHFFGTQVVYDDGDVERLHLKNEKWEFIDEVCPCSLTPLSILSSHFLIHLLPAGARQQS